MVSSDPIGTFDTRSNITRVLSTVSGNTLFQHTSGQEGVEPRIVGGDAVTEGRYPFLAAIFDLVANSNKPQYRCVGSLVSPSVVLSAAHCVKDAKLITLGRHNLEDRRHNYEMFDVVRHHEHPLWSGVVSAQYDFALFELSGRSKFRPVVLNRDATRPWDKSHLHVVGWGMTESWMTFETGKPSSIPLEAKVQSMTNIECQERYGSQESITDDMMCAWSQGEDACLGDSGGPLLIKGDSSEGKQQFDVLAGIVSWGYECADPIHPGVYARTSMAIDWIENTLCEIDAETCPSTLPSKTPIASTSTTPSAFPTLYPSQVSFSKIPTASPSPSPSETAATTLHPPQMTSSKTPITSTISPTFHPSKTSSSIESFSPTSFSYKNATPVVNVSRAHDWSSSNSHSSRAAGVVGAQIIAVLFVAFRHIIS